MKKLFEIAEEYVRGMNWQDVALLKLCVCAIGIIIGISVPKKWKKGFLAGAALVFLVTYIPLIAKLGPAVRGIGGEEA